MQVGLGPKHLEFWLVVRVLRSRPAGSFFIWFIQEFKVSRSNRNIRSVLLHTSADFQQGADSHISVIWYSHPEQSVFCCMCQILATLTASPNDF